MFTVKHIDTSGAETLYEAETVEVVRGKSHFDDGIYLDWPAAPHRGVPDLSGIYPPRDPAKHVINFATARSSDDVPPVVYVMNRFGSTVATYHL